jgi:hypothetical protein
MIISLFSSSPQMRKKAWAQSLSESASPEVAI